MPFKIPEFSLVLLVGVSGSGKSSFAKKHFKSTEIISSDHCRALVSDDENNQSVTREAFEILHFIAAKRLSFGKLTVIDATNVKPEARQSLLALARKYHALPVAIVFNLPESVCQYRNKRRSDRYLGQDVIHKQYRDFKASLPVLKLEGFKHITFFDSVKDVDAAELELMPPLWNKKAELGPFDIIGDVHGCFDELVELLKQLGYLEEKGFCHPDGRKVIFLGDLVDRGPKIPDVLHLVMSMVATGCAFCVLGNHDIKLRRCLKGKKVKLKYGLAESVQQLETCSAEFRSNVIEFIGNLEFNYLLDNGKLVVAHAGLSEQLQGSGSGKARAFALYGKTTGEIDEFGLPVRCDWAADYRGRALVVYGHTPKLEAEWVNNTICIDTGCVFGGKLTAVRYPERELVSVAAKSIYYKSLKPFLPCAV
jgi:protein phosphatase